ncbi:hypothetical protein BU23DRAFT_632428 [Bimuria novae-zelandiae CBS 107.79]|uniref:Uncharacterized protein n=1 Tax=Bimuria novae-zelandiae CBS 107.79 TaxID=1447943 RepID=A0A6A5VIT7_9PLEO|nr:hypothetical protein BU23DRAFT_632428 [Bimuria novae-zelandiae CBS 107.79]
MSQESRQETVRQYKPEERRPISYHLYTIWLITCNDLKSIVLPETAFGIFSSLATSLTTNPDPKVSEVLYRIPHVVMWNWLNVLLFDIANQRLPDSIVEDRVNKVASYSFWEDHTN